MLRFPSKELESVAILVESCVRALWCCVHIKTAKQKQHAQKNRSLEKRDCGC